jgi:HEAT repeat protein
VTKLLEQFDPDLRQAVQQLLSGMSRDVRKDTADQLKPVIRAGGKSVEDLLLLLGAKTTDIKVRRTICWLLSRLAADRLVKDRRQVVTALRKVLSDEDPELRGLTARVLGELPGEQVFRALLGVLQKDPDPQVRAMAAYGLGSLGNRKGVEVLLGIIENRVEPPVVRSHAIEALAYLRDRRAVVSLLRTLSDSSSEVRFWSAFALGEIAGPNAIPALERVAASDRGILRRFGSVRKEAAAAITRIRERTGASLAQ